MAVTGETAKFKLPYFKPGDSPPDMAAVTKAISERVEALLAKGGDVSIAADGTITISNETVDAARITKALKPSGTAAAGTEALRALGATASTACAGNDSRLSDERTPKANSVDSGKVVNGSLTDIDLASPNNSTYKTLMTAGGVISSEATENLYLLTTAIPMAASATSFGTELPNLLPTGSSGTQTASTAFAGSLNLDPDVLIYFDDADYAVGSLTQKLRLRAQVNTNATAWSAVTATFGLYPVTFGGGSNRLVITLGTVVPGSTVAIANPEASKTSQGNSGDFTIPADGQYAIGLLTSAKLTANAMALLTAQLQTRNV